MWGASAAAHLAGRGHAVALIGPDEPMDKSRHDGAFSSHYDMGRITRRLDPKPDWCGFASRAMARYAEIEKSGGIRFHHPVGCVLAGGQDGPYGGYIRDSITAARAGSIPHEILQGRELVERLPFFRFPAGVTALYEEDGAGYINPRAFVACQIARAVQGGVVLIREEVASVSKSGKVRCRNGNEYSGGQIILACGAFSSDPGLLPAMVPLTTYARTIALFELDADEAARLKNLPSLIYVAPDGSSDIYLLPPIRYADGKTYLKIGGDPVDIELKDGSDKRDWFRGDGDKAVVAHLREVLGQLMPDLRYESVTSAACATCYTPNGNPLIHRLSDQLTVLAGGNGAGAKGADEIGRLGAVLALGGKLSGEGYQGAFAG